MNVREVYAKAVAETAALFERRAKYTEEEFALELEYRKDPIYCPICGSCGEDGCCSPGKCEQVRGLYCDSNVESYYELQEENRKMWGLIETLGKTSDYAAKLIEEEYGKINFLKIYE